MVASVDPRRHCRVSTTHAPLTPHLCTRALAGNGAHQARSVGVWGFNYRGVTRVLSTEMRTRSADDVKLPFARLRRQVTFPSALPPLPGPSRNICSALALVTHSSTSCSARPQVQLSAPSHEHQTLPHNPNPHHASPMLQHSFRQCGAFSLRLIHPATPPLPHRRPRLHRCRRRRVGRCRALLPRGSHRAAAPGPRQDFPAAQTCLQQAVAVAP
jgi:hypothetical protein